MMAGKKEFAWDSEVEIGIVDVSEKEKRKASLCTLNGKQFVSIQKVVFVKNEWKIVANATVPRDAFQQIAEMMSGLAKVQNVN